jgi:hypothetical protein
MYILISAILAAIMKFILRRDNINNATDAENRGVIRRMLVASDLEACPE